MNTPSQPLARRRVMAVAAAGSLGLAFPVLRAIARRMNGAGPRIEEFILVGLSYGSWLATSFAMRHPDRLAGLVLSGSAIGVVEDGAGHPAPGHRPHVSDARASFEQHLRAIETRAQVAHERLYVAPARKSSAHDAEPPMPSS